MREHSHSLHSYNIDDSNHTLSIFDESEASEVLNLLAKESLVAGSVWGDIYRNHFLNRVKNPPAALTPEKSSNDGKQQRFHDGIKVEILRESRLWNSMQPPSQDKRKPEAHINDPSSLLGNVNTS